MTGEGLDSHRRMITDPLFYLAAIPAVILVGLSKGGFIGLSVLGMPLFALFVSPIQAAAIMLPILIAQDLVSIWAYRRDYNARTLAVMLPGALAGTLLGMLTAALVPVAAIRLLVGLIAVVFALYWWLGLARYPGQARHGNILSGLFWGLVSGFTSFVSHAGGPPYQVYVLPQNLPRDLFVGTTTWFFTVVNLSKVMPYLWLGQFSPQNLATSLVLVPIAVAATLAGIRLVRRVHGAAFYRVIYALLAAVGLKLVWDGVSGLL
jgi:uncharacterized membrane protein YfcA